MTPFKPSAAAPAIVQLDMTDFPAIPRLAAAIASRWQRLDGFVANAGMLPVLTPVGHVTEENWNRSMAVNLTGQWHVIRAFDPLLQAAPAGRAILVQFGSRCRQPAILGALCRGKARA